jgi:excisionase family DNA binding protein
MDTLLTTTEAARIAGVGVTSIKRWADEDLIRVIRTPGGHRRVVKADLLEFIRRTSGGTSVPLADEEAVDGERWADAILGEDVLTLQGTLLQARGRLGSWHAVVDNLAHGLREIGRRWERGHLTALAEHVGSERLARALAALSDAIPRSGREPVCLLTCVPGDAHTLGLSLLQPCLREAGWAVLWVGQSTPVEDLFAVTGTGQIQMVALTASAASSDPAVLADFLDVVGPACTRHGIRLVMGGAGAWPEPPRHGHRFRTMGRLSAYLAGPRGRPGPARVRGGPG